MRRRSIYLKNLIPVLVPIQNLTQAQFVSIKMIEPLDYTPLAS